MPGDADSGGRDGDEIPLHRRDSPDASMPTHPTLVSTATRGQVALSPFARDSDERYPITAWKPIRYRAVHFPCLNHVSSGLAAWAVTSEPPRIADIFLAGGGN